MFYYNKWLERFAHDHNWKLPDAKFRSEAYTRDNLVQYLKNRQPYTPATSKWSEPFEEAYWESLQEIKNKEFDLSFIAPELPEKEMDAGTVNI